MRTGREEWAAFRGFRANIISAATAGAPPAWGFAAPAAVGAALAHRKYGRLYVHLQNDGDLMYAPGVMWTAAHHRIPLLAVMRNNRAYHQEVMHIQRMADRRQRGIDRRHRQHDYGPQHRFRKSRAGSGLVRRRADRQSQRPWPGY